MNNKNSAVSRHRPNLDDRQAAERKLSKLFASFGIDAMAARERLIDPFIMRAAHFWRGHSSFDLAALALDEAEIELSTWFSDIIAFDDANKHASLMTGRAAFLMCDGPARFADMLLIPINDLPAEFITAMRDQAPDAVPPSDHGDMHHQAYETWSLRHIIAKAVPFEKGMMRTLGDVIRRDGRGFGFNWRNTGPIS